MQTPNNIEEICQKLRPLFGKEIDELYFKYLVAESLEEKNEYIQVLNSLYQKHLSQLLDKNILLEPPKKELVRGEYFLGNVSYAGKELFDFGLREEDWSRHMCITGMSGGGKTTFAYNILKNFIEKGKPFLVFDWKKSFRPLVLEDPSIMCFTVGNNSVANFFKTNINIPPKGVSPKEWINVLCDLLTECFNVSFGVHKILLETLDEIFEGWGIYEGAKHYPNWLHVKKMLENKARDSKGREMGWYESAMRIASILTFGDFGNIINYEGKKSLSIEEIFDKRIILELNSLSSIEKKFFTEYILTYIYKLKKAKEENSKNKFEFAILVDEAHNIFLKKSTNFMAESITDLMYREMREYGISLICLDQHISKLSDTVAGNSACHIAFQQQLPQDIRDISSLMQLFDKKEIFSQIPVGSAIVKLSERYNFPFLIKSPFIDLDKVSVNDEKIKSRSECALENLNARKDKEFIKKYPVEEKIEEKKEIKIEKNESKEELNSKQKILYSFINKKIEEGRTLLQIEHILEKGLHEKLYSETDILKATNFALKNQFKKFPKKIEEENKLQNKSIINVKNLNEEEKKFLNFLEKNPCHNYSTVELYNKIGFSSRKGNNVKKELLEKGLIKIEEIRNEKGWKKFIKLK